MQKNITRSCVDDGNVSLLRKIVIKRKKLLNGAIMLKQMFKLLGKGYKACGECIIGVPMDYTGLWREAINSESATKLSTSTALFPLAIVGTAVFGAFGLVGGTLVTAAGCVLVPVAGVVDIAKKINELKSNDNAPTTAENISNAQQSTHARVIAVLPQSGSESVLAQSGSESSVESLNQYTSYTQAYIDSIKNNPLHSDTIKNLELSPEELTLLADCVLLANCVDSITQNIIDIPVRMNDHIYELDTLEKILSNNSKDSFSNLTFKRRDIQPARDINDKIEQILEVISKNRNNSDNASLILGDNEPIPTTRLANS